MEEDCSVVGEYTNNPTDNFLNNPIREFEADVGIHITLPNDEKHMIVGVWWQHEYQTTTAAYIHNVKKFLYLDTFEEGKWRTQNLKRYFNGFLWNATEQGKEKRKEIVYLENPVYTNQVKLNKIEFTAMPWNSWFPKGISSNTFIDQGSYVPYNLGHDLYVQIELFGCPNYDLNKSK